MKLQVANLYGSHAGTINNKEGEPTTIKLGRYHSFDVNAEPLQEASKYKSNVEGQDDLEYQQNYKIDCYMEITKAIDGKNTIAKKLEDYLAKAQENKGYYIARYEASQGTNGKAISKGEMEVWCQIIQPQAATEARNMYNESTTFFESDLVNSYAWDTAIMFIQKYSNGNSDYANKEGKVINSVVANTGANKDKACNIHDMSGNFAEWSTEYSDAEGYCYVRRGGNYSQSSRLTKDRIAYLASSYLKFIGFRPIIYCNIPQTE